MRSESGGASSSARKFATPSRGLGEGTPGRRLGEADQLRNQLDLARQSCLILNHKVEEMEGERKQQQETIAELRDQLRDQEHRHSRELEMLSEAYSKVFNKLAKKHAMQVQSLEYKVRSVRKLVTERSSEEVE